ncbi:MAG TPA: hypothetical protein VEP91_01050 [Solirubrobacterales bacterium]|nr:hypothetical protein [Solirubrobacterales bacterium]
MPPQALERRRTLPPRGLRVPRLARRTKTLIFLGAATLSFNLALTWIDSRLKATGGPGILGLEFAGSLDRVREIEAEWGAHGEYLARLSLWIDFGFMASYGAFFALAAFAVRDFAAARGLRRLVAVGMVAPACAIAAALFDVAENTLWLLVLGGHLGEPAAPIATACACLKFGLIAVAILYSLAGLLAWVRLRRSG